MRAYGGDVDDRQRDEHERTAEDVTGDAGEEDEPVCGDRPVDRFRRSATGAVVAAGLLGLRDALEGRPEKEEVAIVNEAPDAPPPRDLEVVIDFDHPERSVAMVKRPDDHGESGEGDS